MTTNKFTLYGILALAVGLISGYYIGFGMGFQQGTVAMGPVIMISDHHETPAKDTNLKTYNDPASGIRFEYPEKIAATYITPVDWPPQPRIDDKAFSCVEAGTSSAPAGRTQKRTINGRDYCITEESEGAAGSVYTRYTYSLPFNEKTAILSFSLRSVQCANYDEPAQGACLVERSKFNADSLIDPIAQSLKVKQ